MRLTTEPHAFLQGDCLLTLPTLSAASFDAIVTDPPYEIGFAGSQWDSTGIAMNPAMWGEVLRVAKPGSYLLAFGATRTFHRMTSAIEDGGFEIHDCLAWLYGNGFPKHVSKLKPAWEPIVLARKRGSKPTPLNITRCTDNGRWPANVLLDHPAAELLDADAPNVNPSRFFYVAKPKTDERDAGLSEASGLVKASTGAFLKGLKGPTKERFNSHPTVKPIELMRRLIRLITPRGGLVLDPFGGSGTTGCAAMLEHVRFVGIERDAYYHRMGDARIRYWRQRARRGH